MVNNPYAQYKRQSVTTMTPVEIVIKLYDECERQLHRGIHFIEQKDFANTNKCLMKAYDVVKALQSVLDMKIPMSKDLDALYEYFGKEILAANMKKDTEVIRNILPMVGELKDAFVQIGKMPKGPVQGQSLRPNTLAAN